MDACFAPTRYMGPVLYDNQDYSTAGPGLQEGSARACVCDTKIQLEPHDIRSILSAACTLIPDRTPRSTWYDTQEV